MLAGLTMAPLSHHFTEGTVYFGETIKESGPGACIAYQKHKLACLDTPLLLRTFIFGPLAASHSFTQI